MTGQSMSQVAAAIGRTTAPSGPGARGAGRERHLTLPPGAATNERIDRGLRTGRVAREARTPAERRNRSPASRSSETRVATSESGPSIPA
jgi:hypothetical protein